MASTPVATRRPIEIPSIGQGGHMALLGLYLLTIRHAAAKEWPFLGLAAAIHWPLLGFAAAGPWPLLAPQP